MIHIVDYGLGNIQAFLNMYKMLGIPCVRARQSSDLEGAERLILPGVGAFDHAMELLDASGMRPDLEFLVQERKRPVLGICVGMQILAEGSDEGDLPGLAWVRGRVRSFESLPTAQALPRPHMGWNDVNSCGPSSLFKNLERDPRFYFLHSYYFECRDPLEAAATAEYGEPFACAVNSGQVWGVQFHPEKSHRWGAQLLKNFAEMPAC